jgi:hypothetical protein
MAKLKPGDRVDCRVKEAKIVSPYKDYDEIKTFEIVAEDKYGYYMYVPPYYYLKGTVKADRYQCAQLGIDKKFLGVDIIYIQENMITRISSVLDGMCCANCGEFHSMASPNQEDGTLICYSCRFNPYR